jgi:uncharacterized SAM-binding protein YcdF (DUF218 family)
MFFILSKILSVLSDPLIWVFILFIAAYIKLPKGKYKRLLLGGILMLYFFSNRAIFHHINHQWEVSPITLAQTDTFDVAVVLGGVATFDEKSNQIEFHANADRILKVLPLYFNGQLEKILLSGGSGRIVEEEKEADILADYLISIGVQAEDLILESQSRNTYENAKFSATIIREKGFEKILLSTSAIHMNRAYACFQKQSLEVVPYSTDQLSYQLNPYFDFLVLPKAEVLSYWYWLIHEWVGILTYQLLGYC